MATSPPLWIQLIRWKKTTERPRVNRNFINNFKSNKSAHTSGFDSEPNKAEYCLFSHLSIKFSPLPRVCVASKGCMNVGCSNPRSLGPLTSPDFKIYFLFRSPLLGLSSANKKPFKRRTFCLISSSKHSVP